MQVFLIILLNLEIKFEKFKKKKKKIIFFNNNDS